MSKTKPILYLYEDYKKLLRDWILYASSELKGYQARLAKAIGAPPSFVSQVVRTHVHLTLDHGIKLAKYWKLSAPEADYLLLLIQLSRAGSTDLKDHLTEKLKQLRTQNQDLKNRLKSESLSESDYSWRYYTHWRLGAVHFALMIPELRALDTLAKKLNVTVDEIQTDIAELEDMGLVKKEGKHWVPTQNNLHLSRTSPVSPVNHMIWRQKSILKIMQHNLDNFHYSGLHVLSRADIDRVKEVLHTALERTREIVQPSDNEELVCINCDLFRI